MARLDRQGQDMVKYSMAQMKQIPSYVQDPWVSLQGDDVFESLLCNYPSWKDDHQRLQSHPIREKEEVAADTMSHLLHIALHLQLFYCSVDLPNH